MSAYKTKDKDKGSPSSDHYPTGWSDWRWNEERQREGRYRLSGPDEYEYDWRTPTAVYGSFRATPHEIFEEQDSGTQCYATQQYNHRSHSLEPHNHNKVVAQASQNSTYSSTVSTFYEPENHNESQSQSVTSTYGDHTSVPCTYPGCDQIFGTGKDYDRHYKTVHFNNGDRPFICTVSGCRAGVQSWNTCGKLRAHHKRWHSTHTSTETTVADTATIDDQTITSAGSASVSSSSAQQQHTFTDPVTAGQELTDNTSSVSLSPYSQIPHIRASDRKTNGKIFDPHYKIHRSEEFYWGRIFKVLWAEPGAGGRTGSSDATRSVRIDSHGRDIYEKVRRFVIVNAMEGHCICLPINTYTGRGVNKHGVHAEHHTIVHSTEEPWYDDGEWEKGLTRTPLRVEPSSTRHKLDPMSRLNYAKVYTVEYNVKVWFIGKIHKNSERDLVVDYNKIHPPMSMDTLTNHSARSFEVKSMPEQYALY